MKSSLLPVKRQVMHLQDLFRRALDLGKSLTRRTRSTLPRCLPLNHSRQRALQGRLQLQSMVRRRRVPLNGPTQTIIPEWAPPTTYSSLILTLQANKNNSWPPSRNNRSIRPFNSHLQSVISQIESKRECLRTMLSRSFRGFLVTMTQVCLPIWATGITSKI